MNIKKFRILDLRFVAQLYIHIKIIWDMVVGEWVSGL